jgi:membrane-bound lytic murein transglycosylase B
MKLQNALLAGLLVVASPTGMGAPLDQLAVQDFVLSMEKEHGFAAAALQRIFTQVERSDQILELMTRPAEKVKPWWEYRALFISDKRIRDGAEFWLANEAVLNRATEKSGVPSDVIVAIIGVETSYGRITGRHRVIDALATLAFHYPGGQASRTKFFRAQLEHFLLFTREDGLEPLSLLGSYAGAMGMPQFMPESYRKLAVDFDHDGVRDIWENAADAIGSVANYLKHHGWVAGGQVISPAEFGATNSNIETLLQADIKPSSTLHEFKHAGVTPMVPNSAMDDRAALFKLEARNGNEYWLGYTNFYVISRYNPRIKYAMAVAQLAAAIRDRYHETVR